MGLRTRPLHARGSPCGSSSCNSSTGRSSCSSCCRWASMSGCVGSGCAFSSSSTARGVGPRTWQLGPIVSGSRPAARCVSWWSGWAVGSLAFNDGWFLVVSLMRIDVMISRYRSGCACTFSYRFHSLRHLDCSLQVKTFVDSCDFVRCLCDLGSTFDEVPRAKPSGRNVLAQIFCDLLVLNALSVQ